MTRDEAIEIEQKRLKKVSGIFDNGQIGNEYAAANIDALIELGLLKVDEPKKEAIKITDIETFENGRLILYQYNETQSFSLWYHGRLVWESSDCYGDDMIAREIALLRKLKANDCSPNDLHIYCRSVGIGLVKL